MARIRSVKPELRTSELVASWPMGLRYFWVLLWGYCDDYGRGRDNARLIVADSFPLDDDIDATQIQGWMDVLAGAGMIRRYQVDNVDYFHVSDWANMQKVSHPSKIFSPPPPWQESGSGTSPEPLPSDSAEMPRGGGGVKGDGSGGGGDTPTPYCEAHPKGTNTPCRPCGEARKASELSQKPTLRSLPLPPRRSDRSGYCNEIGHEEYPLVGPNKDCDKCTRALAESRSAA
jgi:hypothetical protein